MSMELASHVYTIAPGNALLAEMPDQSVVLESQEQDDILRKLAYDLGGPSFGDAQRFVMESIELHEGSIKRPVSLLQRRFKLGYRAACVLASALERSYFWEIYYDAGTRMARILHMVEQADPLTIIDR